MRTRSTILREEVVKRKKKPSDAKVLKTKQKRKQEGKTLPFEYSIQYPHLQISDGVKSKPKTKVSILLHQLLDVLIKITRVYFFKGEKHP